MEVTPFCPPFALPPPAVCSPCGSCLLPWANSQACVFSGEPQSVQVDGQARTQKLQGLMPGSHYEVTVVSVRGFEESEPLTGYLTTGEMG